MKRTLERNLLEVVSMFTNRYGIPTLVTVDDDTIEDETIEEMVGSWDIWDAYIS